MDAQLEYYAAHKLVITSALDAGVTDTMEKQPADPVLHLGKQLVAASSSRSSRTASWSEARRSGGSPRSRASPSISIRRSR